MRSTICDLYAEGLDPVLTAAERRVPDTPHPTCRVSRTT